MINNFVGRFHNIDCGLHLEYQAIPGVDGNSNYHKYYSR